jgi:two-component system NtrC family response regulator
VLVAGGGGDEGLEMEVAGGRLVLAAPRIDTPLRALFAVAAASLPAAGPASAAAAARARSARHGDGMLGDSPGMRRALERVERLAASSLAILVLGESGTGKELVARRIHRASRRARAPFVAVNCAALSETLLLSDLFGHVRGAFTGADRERAGVFESAQGGTVFLDEIGDLPAAAQGMLLRVLQEGEVRRLGESLPRKVDVRIVAATHRDLAAMVAAGSFRQDLYYRLKVGNVQLPPLRERGRDVVLLAERFLAAADERGAPPRLSRAAAARLLAHRWPGNVRELQNVLAVAALLAAGGTIEPEHLDLPVVVRADGGRAPGYHDQIDELRRRLVSEALAASGGNQAAAARRLGVSRQALSYLVRQLGLLA